MLLDPNTWDLAQRADELLGVLGDDLAASCSAETNQAAVELATGPCATVGEAMAELGRLRARLARDARAIGLATAAAGMHPGAMVDDPQVSPTARYQLVHRTMRGIARREPTFALHVHVGVADPESAIRLLNRLRAHLPLLLALSANSPLWAAAATGLASNRTILFQAFPRTACRGASRTTPTGSHRRRAHALAARSPSRPSSGGTCGRSRGSAPSRCGSWTRSRRLETTGALCALVQALARLELEEGSPRASSWTRRKCSPRTASSPPATASRPSSSIPYAPFARRSPTW